MKKIYAVTSGHWSDMSVIALFTTRELAEEFMQVVPSNDYNDILEYELDPDSVNMIRQGFFVWNIVMLRDGTVTRKERLDIKAENVFEFELYCKLYITSEYFQFRGQPDFLHIHVWAKTEEHAIEIVNEKREQMIANGEWEG